MNNSISEFINFIDLVVVGHRYTNDFQFMYIFIYTKHDNHQFLTILAMMKKHVVTFIITITLLINKLICASRKDSIGMSG